ncbi:MAG: hypothetical protein EKK40_15715 [Bradyrhizobiaceae bacterium]|nr:MAG: hypothetical protein EKK40_15715 [Bradyrhizobiaceae bacterium]
MNQSSTEKLQDYLAQLSPKSQALLMREFERAIERGDDATMPSLVLGELRKIIRQPRGDTAPRSDDPARLLFSPLEPFLIDNAAAVRPGQIRRSSLAPLWLWLSREGMPAEVTAFQEMLAKGGPGLERTIRAMQISVSDKIADILAPSANRERTLGRIGAPSVAEDLPSIGAVLHVHDALQALGARLPGHMRIFADPQIASVSNALNVPVLQKPQTLPFALSVVMHHLDEPWQIVRLGVSMAGSDDEVRVAGTPYGVAVTMAIQDLSRVVAELRSDIRRGQFKTIADHLKTLHDSVRGLRTELDIRSDSPWGRQLSAIRAEIADVLQYEIDSVPGRVRRLLRQRPDKDITANSRIDPTEVDETAAMIDFVAICRNYASELAINEVTLRAYGDLQQYIEKTTEALVESLRGGDSNAKAFRRTQVQAAIRFCDVLFGPDYAALMQRSADMADIVERKSARG